MYKTAQGALNKSMLVFFGLPNSWGVGSNSILAGHSTAVLAGCCWNRSLFARALGEFATLMLAGNIPGQTQTIPVAIYFAVEAGDMKQASVWVLVILFSLTVLTAVNFGRIGVLLQLVKPEGGREQGKQGGRI